MKTFKDLPKNLKGKRVLIRLDYNVPVEKGKVVDDFRITQSLPTITELQKRGARVIALAHIETDEVKPTLRPVFEHITKKLKKKITFVTDFQTPEGKRALEAMRDGEVVLHENIRQYEGEKKNDPILGKSLALCADYYVNEAFSVSHRSHMSIVGLPANLPSFAGLLFEREVTELSRVFTPKHPFVFILGGAKFETKLPLVQKFLKLADTVFIAGALANDVYKTCGLSVGSSLVSDRSVDLSSIAQNPKTMVASDAVVFPGKRTKSVLQILPEEKIFDAGERGTAELIEKIKKAKQVLWNGPLGLYEQGFVEGTESVAKAIASTKAISIVGGGDTLASIAKLKLGKKFTFLSTAGGAMLDFLANETLPGIDALS